MSEALLAQALATLHNLSDTAGVRLSQVRLVVATKEDAQRLWDALQPPGTQSRVSVTTDIVTSQQDIQSWAGGAETQEPESFDGKLQGVRWEIDWLETSGPAG
jgi:hypothetical protein